MFDRKTYDRERARRIYKEFQERRKILFRNLGNECYMCHKEAIKGFHLHHVEYHEVESNYPTHSKSMYVRLKRLNEAENNPTRFRLLCPNCHQLISSWEYSLSKRNVDKQRLLELLG